MQKHTQQFLLRRREFMKSALMGSLGFGAMSFLKHRGISGVSAFLRQVLGQSGLNTHDAKEIIADALRFGPSLLFVSEALAQDASAAPAVFRVFYATSHDIRNELCLTDFGAVYNPTTTLNFAGADVAGLTAKAPAPFDKTLNMHAYQLLTTGMINGTMAFPSVPAVPALTPDQIAGISLVAAVGMTGTEGVHRRGAIPRVGTLEYSMMQSFTGYSPIGSVAIGTPVVDSSGGVSNPGTTVAGFIGSIDIPGVYMSRDRDNNPVNILDGMTGDKRVAAVRKQMLDAHFLLTQQLTNIKGYSALAAGQFPTYGAREMEGLASMMMFADLFKNGLATVGSTGLNSFDFHATDALRAPAGGIGNMLTESAQALAGTFHIAQAAFAAKRDVIVHFTTCSNRNETWVVDDAHVSTLTFYIRGSGSGSAFKDLPNQMLLMPDGANGMYAEGPGNATPNYSGPDADRLALGGTATVGRMEAGIVRAAGKVANQNPSSPLEDPPAKII